MQLDRDNFRHLTGFGRDIHGHVQLIVDDTLKTLASTPLTGHINVVYDHDDDETQRGAIPKNWGHVPLEEETFEQKTAGSLRIFNLQGGRRHITTVPLYLLLGNRCPPYHLYRHAFLTDEVGRQMKNTSYIGITSRGWRKRWTEHLNSARSGSNYLFHRAVRKYHGVAECELHSIVGWALSEKQAFDMEERLVGESSLYPLGLNMVPGGNAGLAYLRRIGALGKNERVNIDDRQKIVDRFFESASRKGIPNPLAAAHWLNPDYAEKVICAGEDRLKPQQIRDARFMASLGRDVESIATQIGARNSMQVRRLIAGETYSRIV